MASGSGLKAFVTETEIEEKKKKRQEEWEKVREADDPEECPEEEYDPRTLFEKLQEQKDTKQSEFEEQFKFKNMVRGLDDDETKFLEKVSQKQIEREQSMKKEEKELVDQFKNRVVSIADSTLKPNPTRMAPSSGGNRQASLLAGAVKRKRQPSDEAGPTTKKSDHSASDDLNKSDTDNNMPDRLHQTEEREGCQGDATQNGVRVLGILPGIGIYAHSSDDSSNSDSSDSDVTETIGTLHKCNRKK